MNDCALNSLDDRAEARCETCSLNRVEAGVALRIKKLAASPDIQIRLRELGFCEEQIIRLLASHTNYICLVCNARLALSPKLAEVIIVEPLKAFGPQRPHRQSDEAATLHRRAADLSTPEMVTLYQTAAPHSSQRVPAQAKRLGNFEWRLLLRFAIRLYVIGLALAGVGVPTRAAEICSDALARKLYTGKCARCHMLYNPAQYSDEQWQVWMDKMSRKAKLKPDQKGLISHYVEEALRRSPVKSGTEATLFESTNPRTPATQGGKHDVLRRGIKP